MQVMKNFEANRRGCTQKELDAGTVLGAAGKSPAQVQRPVA